jgi:multiple sugar transport system ATP-binding protein
MARVVLEHVTKTFSGRNGERIIALQDLNLTVGDKELLVVVGPSGCGKTTLLRLIAGLDEPTSGTLWMDEQSLNSASLATRDVAMVFQHPALYPHLSASENLTFGLRLRGYSKSEINRRASEVAEALGLTAYLERRPMALSGGQRQRVALGRVLVRHPKLILFDEPLSNLDPHLRHQLRLEISEILKRSGATAIYVTHDQAEAMLLGGRVAVLNQGVIQQLAQPLELYQRPANLFVAGFFGSPPMNFFNGTVRRSGEHFLFVMQPRVDDSSSTATKLHIVRGQESLLSSFVNQQLVLGLRPEHIRPGLTSNGAVGGENVLMAMVKAVENLGAETHLRLQQCGHEFIARGTGEESFAKGKALELEFKMDQAHFFDQASGVRIDCR